MTENRPAAGNGKKAFFAFLERLERPASRLTSSAKARYVYLLAFFIPFVIVGVLWLCHGVLFANRMILAHDQWHQYYPFYLDLRDKLRNGNSLFYSWTVGMGTNYLSLLAYYLASPFNFITVLLPESLLLSYYTLTVLIRISCAGLFFAVLLRRACDRNDVSVVFFATAYALCAFIMGYYWNAIWLDTVALLPLVVLGMFRLLRDKKYSLYTLSLALSLLCSYYIGLFTCIFVLLLFFVYNICCWDDLGGFWSRLFRIAFFSALAIGMTAFLTLPAYFGLQTTSSAVNKFPTQFATNINSDATLVGVLDAIRQVFSNLGAGITPTSMEGLPNVYCGVVTVLFAMLFFCCKKIKIREKVCCGFLLVFFALCFIIRQADYIMHGCHFPNMLPYRFSFLFSFVLIWMGFRGFTQLGRFRWYHLLCIAPLLVGFLYCVISAKNTLSIVLSAIILALSIAALLLYGLKRISRSLLSACVCLFLILELTVGALLGVHTVSTTSADSYPKDSKNVEALVTLMNERESDTVDRWRAEVTMTQTLNDDALNGFNGVSTFSSAANSNVSDLLQYLGVASSVAGNRYVYQQSDAFTNMLLGIKYLIDREGYNLDTTHFSTVESAGSALLLQNDYYLPMGYMVSSDILDYGINDLSEEDPYGNLNKLAKSIFGNDTKLYLPYWMSAPTANGSMDLTVYGNDYFKMVDDTGSASAYSTMTVPYDCELCLYIRTWNAKDVSVYINNNYMYSYSANYGYNRYLGKLSAGDEIKVTFAPKAGKNGYVRVMPAVFDSTAFKSLYTALSKWTMTASKVTDTEIDGTIRAKSNRVFFTSIPYDDGWHVTVDDEPVEQITPVGGAFIAFPLETGQHTIRLYYETPGFSLGWKISLICLGVFLLLALIELLIRLTQPSMRKVTIQFEDEGSLACQDLPQEVSQTPTEPTGSMPPLDTTSILPTEPCIEQPTAEPDKDALPDELSESDDDAPEDDQS